MPRILLKGLQGLPGIWGVAVACLLSLYEMSSWLVYNFQEKRRHMLSCTGPGA